MKLSFYCLLLVGFTACNSPNSASSSSVNPAEPAKVAQIPANSQGMPPAPVVVAAATATPAPAPSSSPIKNISGVGLVWNGAGACNDGCWLAAANVVTSTGLTVRYVNEQTAASSAQDIAAIFAGARVWVMPGGHSAQEVGAMSNALIEGLQDFVAQGGGYVGWCAGAFSATQVVGTSGKTGLGLMPGNTKVFITSNKQNNYGASIENLSWITGSHSFYLEGGPYLYNLPSSVEVIARYDDQVSVAAARTGYGNGRVFISGVHPEAPSWWWSGTSISDPDGTDEAYAADMVKWAASFE